MSRFSKLKLVNKFIFRNIHCDSSSKCDHIEKKVSTEAIRTVVPLAAKSASHLKKFNKFLEANPHILSLRSIIPQKYTELHTKTRSTFIYLIAKDVAQKIVCHVLPDLQANSNQLIFISKPGLGLIPAELIAAGIKPLRLCEPCSLFQDYLKTAFGESEEYVKLFTKDILAIPRIDSRLEIEGSELQQLFEGITKKNWDDSPALTIIGSIPDRSFIIYLIKCLMKQEFMIRFGRLQMFLFMRPSDYVQATVEPHLTYFVKITFKKNLPVERQDLLAFYVFICHFMRSGSAEVIQSLEKWKPGLGLKMFFPTSYLGVDFPNVNIFTKFGELTPKELLNVFKEILGYTDIDGHHLLMLGSDFDKACSEYFTDISYKTNNSGKVEATDDN